MRLHLQYIAQDRSTKSAHALTQKAHQITKLKGVETEIGEIRRVEIPDRGKGLVIDIWLVQAGAYWGDTLRRVRNHGEPHAYVFEP